MKARGRRWALAGLLAMLTGSTAFAHVGSKDVFEEVQAGPYKLFVTVRAPNVIPGVAGIEVRTNGSPVDRLLITPLPMTGEASKHPPTADAMVRSPGDAQFFTGSVWMMSTGSWQVRFAVSGAGGDATAAVPVPAVAVSTLKMQRGMGTILGLLGLFLVVSMAGIVTAAVRDARLPPGLTAPPARQRWARYAALASLVVMALMAWGGAAWWNVEAASYGANVYRPLTMTPRLAGGTLDLAVGTYRPRGTVFPNDARVRSNKDFLPDHGHLMHLYVIRQPEMDAVFHLHPSMSSPGDFRVALPAMPPGDYKLYGDVVHANGFPETLQATLTIPATLPGGALDAEDAEGLPHPLSAGMLGASYALPDSYTMVWDKPATLTAGTAEAFRFRLLDAAGKPASDMQPYLGMAGHAAFVKTDGTVFAHTHPEGSAAMQAMTLAEGAGTPMTMEPITNTVEFPYGFPTPGRYRIFVQMKHSATVETGTFDAEVK